MSLDPILAPFQDNFLKQLVLKYFCDDGTSDPDIVPAEHRSAFFCLSERKNAQIKWENVLVGYVVWWGPVLAEILRTGKKKSVKFFAVTDAKQAFSFTAGHPQIGEMYIQHPLDPQYYLPAKDYLRELYEEKVNELRSIIGDLAVKRLEATFLRGVSIFGSMSASAKIEGQTVGGSAKAGYREAMALELIEEYEPDHPPRRPEGPGYRWLQHERIWQGLVKSRIEDGLKKCSLRFVHNGMATLGGEAAAIVHAVNGKAGFDSSYAAVTEWDLKMDFSSTNGGAKARPSVFDRMKKFLNSK